MAKKKRSRADADTPDSELDGPDTEALGEDIPAEVSEEDQKLADAQQAVNDATADHAETKKILDEAKAELDAVVATRGEKPVYGKHILVSFGGAAPVLRDAPRDWEKEKPRVLRVDGVNVEHVGEVQAEDADGNKGDIWVYRQM